jgi:NhaP-type Na+/H+ or K+/H+ antiporter
MEHAHQLAVSLAGLFILGTAGQWIAAKMRLPSILFLLGFGILAGPVAGWLKPDELLKGGLLFAVVSLAVAVILFEGSLNLKFVDLRGIRGVMLSLLTTGVAVTWALSAMLGRFVLHLDWSVSLLLGAILVVTGPTVIGPLLRQIRPTGRVGPIARWEGIVIDPVGAVLAVLVFEANREIQHAGLNSATWMASMSLLRTVVVGGSIGVSAALFVGWLLKRHELPDHLQSPVTLMFVIAGFTLSNLGQPESGLVAVTVMGIVLANLRGIDLHPILEFKETLSMLLISSLFILLSARLEFSSFASLGWGGAIFLLAMLLIVRPASVFASTMFSGLDWREKTFLAWFAPRGIVAAAVSSIFGLQMANDGQTQGADQLVAATFLVIIGTVVVYGFTAFPLARWLGLAEDDPQGVLIAGAHPGARAIAHALQDAGITVLMVDSNPWNIHTARLEGLRTRLGNILSEQLVAALNLGGLGRFLALTPNDEVNALAAVHLRAIFGRANTYQLVPYLQKEKQEIAPHSVRARFLFSEDATNVALDERFAAGAVVKTTRLSEEFTFADFRRMYGDEALVLFVVTELGKLRVEVAGEPSFPKPGQTVIALVQPPPEQLPHATE